MALLWSISASDEASWPRLANASARACVTYIRYTRLYFRNSRFYSTRTDPNSVANPNLSRHHRGLNWVGVPMSRIRFFLVAAMALAVVTPTRWSAAFLAVAPAMAAEMPVKAPWQAPVVQAYDWTGLYVGSHLGYAWGHSNWSAPPNLSSSLDLDQSSDISNGSGSYFGGLQIGYDVMLANRVVLGVQVEDRKSTRLNSSHLGISYAVFCLKQKK